MRRLSTESTGLIWEAGLSNDPFDSHSDNGVLVVEIRNLGVQKTNYIVTVTDCDFQIVQAIPAQARTLYPRGQAWLYFDIHTKYSLYETNVCYVTLKSPTGTIYAGPLAVNFDTDEFDVDYQASPWRLPPF